MAPLTCPTCGCTGIHACIGFKPQPPTEAEMETLRERMRKPPTEVEMEALKERMRKREEAFTREQLAKTRGFLEFRYSL